MALGASPAPILFIIVPTQNEPSGATTPSFSRVPGWSGSIRAIVRNGPPKSHSATSLRSPTIAPPSWRRPIDVTRSGVIPGLVIRGQRIQPMDFPPDDVDPDQPAAAVVPDQALADDVARIEDQFRFRFVHLPRPSSAMADSCLTDIFSHNYEQFNHNLSYRFREKCQKCRTARKHRLSQVPALSARRSRRSPSTSARRACGPGDLLPSEAAMTRQLNVSRTVVREAFRSLAAMRLIDIAHRPARARVAKLDTGAHVAGDRARRHTPSRSASSRSTTCAAPSRCARWRSRRCAAPTRRRPRSPRSAAADARELRRRRAA